MEIEILNQEQMIENYSEKRESTNSTSEKLKILEMEMRLRGFSKQTSKMYKFYNIQFLEYIKKEPINVTETDIKEYISHKMLDDSISNSSIGIIRSGLLFYYNEILNKNIIIKAPKKDKKLPVVLTREEIIKLIDTAENPKHKILIELLYSTGMRLSEALNLKYSDINFNNCEGWIRKGKGSKDRLFYIGAELQNNLLKYHENFGGEYIFHVKGKQMSVRGIQHIIKIITKRAGINKPVHVHTLRHTFATHLYEDGIDVLKIQALLGHTNLSTTQLYAHISNTMIKNVKNPLDKLLELKNDGRR